VLPLLTAVGFVVPDTMVIVLFAEHGVDLAAARAGA
jgi:hypothetical protein